MYDVVILNRLEPTDKWKKDDAIAQKVLITTIDKRPLLHLLDCKTAFEIWTKIKTIYERDNEQQKYNLLQNFYSLTYDKSSDVVTYISKLKNLANRLKVLKVELDDNMIISKILVTLPDEYGHFASAWESTEMDSKTLENLTARLIAEEMRIKARISDEKEVAFKTASKKCFRCNKVGHFSKDCRVKTNQNNKHVRCFRCNKIGHIEKSCKEKPQSKNTDSCSMCKKTNHTDKNCFFRKDRKRRKSFIFAMNTDKGMEWIVDSGTTSNLTNNLR